MAEAKKKARQEKRTIIFIDESGLSERPHRVRTWAPKGKTPQLTFNFGWKTLSVIAGISPWRFYFRLHPGAIKGPDVVSFIEHLLRHVSGKLLLVWDGAMIHRSKLVREFLDSLKGRVIACRLPPYAPELNPAEYIWAYLKQHEIPNLCPKNIHELGYYGRRALRRMRRRPRLITAFWKQAELFE